MKNADLIFGKTLIFIGKSAAKAYNRRVFSEFAGEFACSAQKSGAADQRPPDKEERKRKKASYYPRAKKSAGFMGSSLQVTLK